MTKTLTHVFGVFFNGLSAHGIKADTACVDFPKDEFMRLRLALIQEFEGQTILTRAVPSEEFSIRLHGILIRIQPEATK